MSDRESGTVAEADTSRILLDSRLTTAEIGPAKNWFGRRAHKLDFVVVFIVRFTALLFSFSADAASDK